MEVTEPPSTSEKECIELKAGDMEITSNWKIVNEKSLDNSISTVDVITSPGRANLEDVVSLETCIRLEGNMNEKREPCSITIKLKNGQKIARIAIISEAFLIEIYKQFGEYVSTAHAEFIDEFEQSAVYFADVCLSPPTPELTIKFARMKNPGTPMWLYGIGLSLTEPLPKNKSEEQFDYKVIGDFLQTKSGAEGKPVKDWAMKAFEKCEGEKANRKPNDLDSFLRDFMTMNVDSPKHTGLVSGEESQRSVCKKENVESMGDSKDIRDSDYKTYIDDRLREMEERLTTRIDVMNYKTNEKLDNIIKLLRDKSQ